MSNLSNKGIGTIDAASLRGSGAGRLLRAVERVIRRKRWLYLVAWPGIAVRRQLLRARARALEGLYRRAFAPVESGTVVLHVPEYTGRFEMDIRSHILKRLLTVRHYEPELVRLLHRYVPRNADAIDIGANVGLYTVLLVRILQPSQRVLAIEPIPWIARYLNRNVERNGVTRSVIIFEGVAAEHSGPFGIHAVVGREEYSSMGGIVHPSVTGNDIQRVTVQGETVDSLVDRHDLSVGFLKIDTEGAEHGVFRGSVKTLATMRPVVLSELSDRLMAGFGTSVGEVLNLLKEHGYCVMDVRTGKRPALPFDGEVLAFHPQRVDTCFSI